MKIIKPQTYLILLVALIFTSCTSKIEENQNGDYRLLDKKKEWIEKVQKETNNSIPFLAAIGVRFRATPELVEEGVKVSVEAGVDGITLGHYDGASFPILRAVRNGLYEAGVEGVEPILGVLARDMKLHHYTRHPWLYTFGIATETRGEAKYIFDYESGMYDLRISYADEKGGDGSFTAVINNKEIAKWQLNKDFDCWKVKTIPNIRIKKGDEISIIGEGNEYEWARFEFVEFVKK